VWLRDCQPIAISCNAFSQRLTISGEEELR